MFKNILKKRGLTAMVFCLCLMSAAAFAAGYKDASKREILDVVAANKGKVVVVNVFASWCPPCQRETPDLVRFYQRTAPEKDIAFFAVSMDESGLDLNDFIARFNIPYPVFRGDEDFLDYLGSYSIPQLLIFDRSGNKVKHEVGMISFDELMNQVAPYIAAKK